VDFLLKSGVRVTEVKHTNENISTTQWDIRSFCCCSTLMPLCEFKGITFWLLPGCWSSVRYFVYRLPLVDLNKQPGPHTTQWYQRFMEQWYECLMLGVVWNWFPIWRATLLKLKGGNFASAKWHVPCRSGVWWRGTERREVPRSPSVISKWILVRIGEPLPSTLWHN